MEEEHSQAVRKQPSAERHTGKEKRLSLIVT